MDKVTPKCPYCGSEMEISKYDVQEGGVIGYQYFCEMCDGTSPLRETKDAAYAAAMRRYQPENRVLTLAELDERESVFAGMGEPVYVERKNDIGIWGIVRYSRECMPCCEIVTASSGNDGCLRLPRKNYGKAWRCWLRRPTDEEREAAKWGDATSH